MQPDRDSLPDKQPDTPGIHRKPNRSDDPKKPSAPSLITESDDADSSSTTNPAERSKRAGEDNAGPEG